MAAEHPQDSRSATAGDANRNATLRRRLISWYRRRARPLPWRATRDPYAIWVSEIMLQQTQVAAAIPYYERFLAAFPTVNALAAAPQEKVLRLWEGLGYYSRARNLHRAAQALTRRHAGELPRDAASLRCLPGIGRYTAGAILSIAFDLPEPILEANSRRVFVRLFALPGDPTRQPLEGTLWTLARSLLPRRNVGDFNQAVMELGSEVCTAGRPHCTHCPLADLCLARQHGLENELPAASGKTATERVREATVVVRHAARVLVVQQPPMGRWAGMFDFPRIAAARLRDHTVKRRLADRVEALTGCRIEPERKIGRIQHGVTRFHITLDCYLATYRKPRGRARLGNAPDGSTTDQVRWVTLDTMAQLPMPVPARRVCALALGDSQRAVPS